MARSSMKSLVEYQRIGLGEAKPIQGIQADQDLNCANDTPTAAVRAAVEATKGSGHDL